jgi:tRNA G46 methylase TrmB
MSVHPMARTGFASDTGNYDASRPEHQPTAVNKLLKELNIPPHGRIVEIGSGTGKFTSHLLNREENWEVICVEPSEVFIVCLIN